MQVRIFLSKSAGLRLHIRDNLHDCRNVMLAEPARHPAPEQFD
jgi:hypothetical protein